MEYINTEIVRREIKVLRDNKSKFISVHASSGDK